MELRGKVIVITGAAHGIGHALALRFAAEEPEALILADIDIPEVSVVAATTGALAVSCDVSREGEIQALVKIALDRYGRVDLFCSNAGIISHGGPEAPDSVWDRQWRIHLMAHVWAARALLPSMLARGEGYLLSTASAAGLLTAPGSAPYSVTKHATVAFAEWLSVTYGAKGVKVSCLCPEFVDTAMVRSVPGPMGEWMRSTSIQPEAVAECVVDGLAREQFLILPHPHVAEYFRRRASDHDRWLSGMRRLLERVERAEP